jgi:hypothetical protein
MNIKFARKKNVLGCALSVLIAMALLVQAPGAVTTQSQTFCSSILPPGPGPALSNYASLDGLVGISLLILLTMSVIAGIVYVIGSSFRINSLVRFSKQEVGEIILTAIIVLIFIGTFAIGGAFKPPKIITITGAYNENVFIYDCGYLANSSISLIPLYFDVLIGQDMINLLSSLKITVMPEDFGFSDTPLSGYSVAASATGVVLNFSVVLTGLLVATAVLLGIFYALLPIFLFAGIILRTLPFTRAAGGAFLGLFIAFYIFFPNILHFTLTTLPTPPLILTPPSNVLNGILSNITNFVNIISTFGAILSSTLSPTALLSTVIGILVDNIYAAFAAIISLILSFDFMETMGDLLGSPSLQSGNTLKRLL